MKNHLRIGTRNSALALAQSELVKKALIAHHPQIQIEFVPLVTTGDYRRDKLNLHVEDKKQWVVDIENMLISQAVDIAVHSAKDVPSNIEDGTCLMTVLERESAMDILFYRPRGQEDTILHVSDLPVGAVVGTSSKRRTSQLLKIRPDFQIVPIRGNINSRLEKLNSDGSLDAIVIASAGVNRLELKTLPHFELDYAQMIPAVGQGQLVAQYLDNRSDLEHLLSSISLSEAQLCFEMERLVVEALEADCHSSIGVNAHQEGDRFYIKAIVLSQSGSKSLVKELSGKVEDALKLSQDLSNQLLAEGAKSLLLSR